MTDTYGNRIKVKIYGASHSEKIGVTVRGIPAGTAIDMEDLKAFLRRRAPGKYPWETPRKEADEPVFLSGIEDGVTTGDTIEAVIYNTNIRPADYDLTVPRPGHADLGSWLKYGRIESGGGRWSGRMTAPMCIAGGICKGILRGMGIEISAHISELAGITDDEEGTLKDGFPVYSDEAGERMIDEIMKAKEDGDSIGGIIGCTVTGMPAGLGDALFEGIEGRIAEAVFAIPAVKGIEFGDTKMKGSENNDAIITAGNRVVTETNNHGGILGGISTGMPVTFSVKVKPTPSIGKTQRSVDLETMEEIEMTVKGRHDPCILPRAVPCVEAACAIALLDIIEEENNGTE